MEQDSAGSPVRTTLPDKAAILKTKTLQATNRVIATSLAMLEDLGAEHDEAMDKLRAKLPAELVVYVDLADYFTDARFESMRNRILRSVNDARREIEETIENIRFDPR